MQQELKKLWGGWEREAGADDHITRYHYLCFTQDSINRGGNHLDPFLTSVHNAMPDTQ